MWRISALAPTLMLALLTGTACGTQANQPTSASSSASTSSAVSVLPAALAGPRFRDVLVAGVVTRHGKAVPGVHVYVMVWPRGDLLDKGKEGQKVQTRQLRPATTDANGQYAVRVPAGRLPKKYVGHGVVNFDVWLMGKGVPLSTYTEFPARHGRRGDGASSPQPKLVDFDLGTRKIIEHDDDGTVQHWPLDSM